MSGCSAVGCSNRGDRGFFMKSFPRNPERRALWASQTNRDGWQPTDNSRLCEVHFDQDQWEKTREDGTRKLKCNAVPTIFETSIHSPLRKKCPEEPKFIATPNVTRLPVNHSDTSTAFIKSFNVPNSNLDGKTLVCSAANCSSQFEARWLKSFFYEFPLHDPVLLEKWLTVCRKGWIPSAQSVICRKHFSMDCFDSNNGLLLKNNAIPNIHLNNDFDLDPIWEPLNDKVGNIVETNESEDNIYCRICASSKSQNYFPIFGDSNLAEKISRCLPVIVLPTDNLPLYICQHCLYYLNVSYKLIICSLRADTILRSKFGESNTPKWYKKPTRDASKVSKHKSMEKEEPIFRINGPIKCDLCDDFFEDMNMFDRHIETFHLLKWRCSFCDHSFETSHELLAHKMLNHSGRILACKNCEKVKVEEIFCDAPGILSSESMIPQLASNVGHLDISLPLNLKKSSELRNNLSKLNCTKCKIVFVDAKQFRTHHIIHLPRRVKCSLCQRRCQSVFEYLMHKRVAHNQLKTKIPSPRNDLHNCKYCNKVFLRKQKLMIHMRVHKQEMLNDPSVTVYKCVTCPKIFVDKVLYQKHRNVHDPACWNRFRCEICCRAFGDRFKLKSHETIHNGTKPYQCDICGHTFNRNANMIRHRAKHSEQTCRFCDNVFKSMQILRKHLRDVHGETFKSAKRNSKVEQDGRQGKNSRDVFICRYCGKQLTSYYSLLDHERIHTGDKPFVCHHCGKFFRSITARWDHMVRHEKGNYICELCGKVLSNKLNLKSHLRKHAAIEQRRFECKECGKLFYVRGRLDAHLGASKERARWRRGANRVAERGRAGAIGGHRRGIDRRFAPDWQFPSQSHQYRLQPGSISPTIGPQFADQSLGKCRRKYPIETSPWSNLAKARRSWLAAEELFRLFRWVRAARR
ncbi:zinc finger protein 267-like [Neodiprion virginianus]|uniref:zinc finger protein 267-like n=1 Tax=Neodiprion virginianus TaxID=2961670 RepID=UPI001EE71229|nr:zinc finger protein 267-like [Neodiprion virginianus]